MFTAVASTMILKRPTSASRSDNGFGVLRVDWTNGDASASTEVWFFNGFTWDLDGTAAAGVTFRDTGLGMPGDLATLMRIRHRKGTLTSPFRDVP